VLELVFRKRSRDFLIKYSAYFLLHVSTSFPSMFSALPRILTSRRIHGIWDFFSQYLVLQFSYYLRQFARWKLKSSSFEQIVCYSIHLNSQIYFHIFKCCNSLLSQLYKLPGMYRNYWSIVIGFEKLLNVDFIAICSRIGHHPRKGGCTLKYFYLPYSINPKLEYLTYFPPRHPWVPYALGRKVF